MAGRERAARLHVSRADADLFARLAEAVAAHREQLRSERLLPVTLDVVEDHLRTLASRPTRPWTRSALDFPHGSTLAVLDHLRLRPGHVGQDAAEGIQAIGHVNEWVSIWSRHILRDSPWPIGVSPRSWRPRIRIRWAWYWYGRALRYRLQRSSGQWLVTSWDRTAGRALSRHRGRRMRRRWERQRRCQAE